MNRTLKISFLSLICNAAYSIYHIGYGFAARSWWLLTTGVYYVILSILRFAVLQSKGTARFIIRFAGILLMVLSLPLVGTVVLAFMENRGTVFPLVVMLAIAVYSFTKISLATVNWFKSRRSASAKLITLRNISFADAFVSIFSLQRSMLVSFEGMSGTEIRIMNIATGSGVCIIVFLLGLHLLRKKQITPQDCQECESPRR